MDQEAEGGVSQFRPLRKEDAKTFAEAFAAIGWSKPASGFEKYFEEQTRGLRWVQVVEWEGTLAGYVTVAWSASDRVLRDSGIPEIMDLNVLPQFRKRGLGSALMASAEAEASRRSSSVGLRVGLHSGYGAAQRIYVRRGYVPDGTGAVIEGEVVPEGSSVRLDDDITLRMTRDLPAPD